MLQTFFHFVIVHIFFKKHIFTTIYILLIFFLGCPGPGNIENDAQFNVVFEGNAGNNSITHLPEVQNVNKGGKVTEPTVKPINASSTEKFLGWYKDAAGIQVWSFSTDTVTENIILYAKWVAVDTQTYAVSFDKNTEEGTVTDLPDVQIVANNTIASEPLTQPKRTGYTFEGWYKEATNSTVWNFSMDTVTKDTTLYAQWNTVATVTTTYTVTFDGNATGDTLNNVPSPQNVNNGGTVTEPAAPTRSGYSFERWYTDAAGTQVWGFPTDTVTENIILYAKWIAVGTQTYTVSFDRNTAGDTVIDLPDAQTVEENTTASEPLTHPKRNGYTFGGWYTEAMNTTAWNFSIDTVTRDTTLYALWNTVAATYTVTFDGNATGDTLNNVPSPQNVNDGGIATEPAAPVRTGYTFERWYKDAASTTAWNFATGIITADTTLYAKWTVVQYSLSFDGNAAGYAISNMPNTQNINYKNLAINPAAPARTGYIFEGWFKEPKGTTAWNFATDEVTANTMLYAKWNTAQHILTFNGNAGGDSVSNLTSSQNVDHDNTITEPVAPARTGYTFDGWYKTATGGAAWNFATDTVRADTMLYAKWSALQYTLTFNGNAGGDTVTGLPSPQNVDYRNTATEPAAPARTGYAFEGWYKTSTGNTAWSFSADTITTNTNLYAKWDIVQYTVSFVGNARKGNTVTNLPINQIINYGAMLAEPMPPTNSSKADFMGWYREATNSTAWNFAVDTVTADTKLYAKWPWNYPVDTFQKYAIGLDDLALDANNNVFVVDSSNNIIQKITPSGNVTTLAGGGIPGFVDGIGSNAKFNNPQGLTVDADGNIYVADTYNHSIRKITPAGNVTTLAGGGTFGFVDGIGSNAKFHNPQGLTVDADGNIYVADNENHSIRKITPAGNVTTLAGMGVPGSLDGLGSNAQFNNPQGLTVDADGNIYVADTQNHRIRKITPTGNVTTFAGSSQGITNGSGTNAKFSTPRDLIMNTDGNIYVVEARHYIRKVTPAADVTIFAGMHTSGYVDGPAIEAQFESPSNLANDADGNIYVNDRRNIAIRKIHADPRP